MTAASVPTGTKRRCEIQGRNDTGENWRTDTEMIPKHNNLIGGQSTLSLILREILSGSMAVILPKIAPKHDTKNRYPSISTVAAEMGGFSMIGGTMPRMSKKRKLELSFFLNDRGRVAYNDLCRKCQHECKQSFRAVVVDCPHYLSKRAKRKEKTD